ncbi:diacylglycerol kinase family lipid kinase [Nitratireductor mangrovi]|uniref:Diacylglycerol kinase family lipid kinase n=1 Tax=Nitratireductor mangrovi TaxID=2599600 RepID=A0A5B8KVU2_9HYPH|nr:diacylglycerol kinase family protein [Nitratireductor mangrovi]QDY99813.1 diacylglycerol kinase family lipid kinase [Nitratireductor mangrovi]
MRLVAILNREGGTLRTTDLDWLSAHIRDSFDKAGHSVDIEIVRGGEVEAALKRAAAAPDVDAVIAAGGDGTISAAAAALMNSDKALAILPAGTMNLFARSLKIPLSLSEAVEALAAGTRRRVDIATADGRPFIHQFSIGLHARMVMMRSRFEYGSRLGKILASVRASLAVMARPPAMDVALEMGETKVLATTSGIGISNNLFGDGHLPYADEPDRGVLGIYVLGAAGRLEIAWLMLALAAGRWKDVDTVEIHETAEAVLRIRSRRRLRAVIDGELCSVGEKVELRIHPGALTVLVPHAE